MAFVLDASVALAWCFSDESNAYADAISHRLWWNSHEQLATTTKACGLELI
jgi:hypothetical protein